MAILQTKFSNEEDYQRYLLVPLIINSYNAGVGRVGEVLDVYVKKTPAEEMPSGEKLFVAIAEFGFQAQGTNNLDGYSKDAREYVSRIYAQTEILNEEKKQVE